MHPSITFFRIFYVESEILKILIQFYKDINNLSAHSLTKYGYMILKIGSFIVQSCNQLHGCIIVCTMITSTLTNRYIRLCRKIIVSDNFTAYLSTFSI